MRPSPLIAQHVAFLVQVVCHDASSTSATECGQDFSVHGIHMPIPDGTPCWHPSEPNVQRIRFFWGGGGGGEVSDSQIVLHPES